MRAAKLNVRCVKLDEKRPLLYVGASNPLLFYLSNPKSITMKHSPQILRIVALLAIPAALTAFAASAQATETADTSHAVHHIKHDSLTASTITPAHSVSHNKQGVFHFGSHPGGVMVGLEGGCRVTFEARQSPGFKDHALTVGLVEKLDFTQKAAAVGSRDLQFVGTPDKHIINSKQWVRLAGPFSAESAPTGLVGSGVDVRHLKTDCASHDEEAAKASEEKH